MQHQFYIKGEPVRAPRMTRRDRWAKRPAVVKYYEWSNSARQQCFGATHRKIDGAKIDDLEVVFYLPIAASMSAPKRAILEGQRHAGYPDIDNLLKALLDALVSQDKHVWRVRAEKRYQRPGEDAHVEVIITLKERLDDSLVTMEL